MTTSTKDCTESLSCSHPGSRDHPTAVTEVPYVIHEAQMWSYDQCTWWPHTGPNLVSFKTPYTDRSSGWNHLWQLYQFWLVSALDKLNDISSAQICQIWLFYIYNTINFIYIYTYIHTKFKAGMKTVPGKLLFMLSIGLVQCRVCVGRWGDRKGLTGASFLLWYLLMYTYIKSLKLGWKLYLLSYSSCWV